MPLPRRAAWRACAGLVLGAGVLLARPARGEGVEDEARALTVAESALEYRDFEKAVQVLRPWVHPPRISDPKRMAEARRVLGISEHVLGNVSGAREEFGQLLLLEPDLKLDPFVVPPQVIETFETVRNEMKPMLDRIRKERGVLPPPPEPKGLKLVPVPTVHPMVNLLPFGVPQFVQKDTGLGLIFAGMQGVGLAANLAGYFGGRALQRELGHDEQDVTRLRVVQYAGLGTFLAGWVLSGALAFSSAPDYNRALLDGAASPAGHAPGLWIGVAAGGPGVTLGGEL